MNEPTRDELIAALQQAVFDGSVKQFVLNVKLACKLYPEAMKEALGEVFDLKAVEDYAERVMVVCNRAEQKATDAAYQLDVFIRGMTERTDLLSTTVDHEVARLAKGARAMNALAKEFKQLAQQVRKQT